MIDFFASATIALIVIMTLVLFLSNQRQASILKRMRLIMEDWFDAQMRDRRKIYKEKIRMPDVLVWLGSQVGLSIVEQGRLLVEPPAAEFLTAEGDRLVISPLPKGKLRNELRRAEGKRRKVAKLVQPLLGYHPFNIKVLERSNKTVHEWYEVEIETALEKLGIHWGDLKNLYFYVIPQEPEKVVAPLVSFDLHSTRIWFKKQLKSISDWFGQRQTNQPSAKTSIQHSKSKAKPKTKKKTATTNVKKSGIEA
jgi:hypothetical protein